ncbi:hypothetical protein MKW92_046389 [Papaver armeniacum]|nr:hypothetical protein MKW92_046389 [Papaver armeniacum]
MNKLCVVIKSFVSEQDKTNILNLKKQSIPPNSTQIILFGFLFRPRGSGGCHSPSDELIVRDFLEFGFRFVINNVDLSCVCAQRRDSDDRSSLELTTNKGFVDASYPGEELHGLVFEQWKDMGWQEKDPSTDFRGGGFISVENLFFARSYKKSFQDLLRKQEGDRAMWEYPLAVVGVDITFMLTQMLDLKAVTPRTIVGVVFAKLLSDNFKLMDQQWLEMRASYMDFNSTRHQLEKELLLDDITNLKEIVIW